MGSGNGFEWGVRKNLKNFIYEIKKFYCRIIECMICYFMEVIVYYKVLTSQYIEWEVVQMKFDFKDLMAFGMFILALLTLINLISR